MLIALALSIIFSLAVGIFAARNKRAESIVIPLLDVFQSIPILGFFPLVIFGIIGVFPGEIGINIAVILLIFTSMSWNIAFGVYEAVKSIPQDYIDLSSMSQSNSFQRIASLYIPASLSRIAYNTQTSWAVGLFYLVSSEIISLGTGQAHVSHGIGVDVIGFLNTGDTLGYLYALFILILAVIVWQVVFLREFALWAERYKFVEEPRELHRDYLMKFYSWVRQNGISKIFLIRPGRGVTNFSSTIFRFKRGIKYAVLIFIAILTIFEISASLSSTTSALRHIDTLPQIIGIEGAVIENLAVSFVRIWYVYFICVLIAVPLGIVVSLRPRVYDTSVPIIEVIASVPAPILLPIIYVVALGQGEAVAAIIIFLGMIWYILFNVMAGIRTLPAELWELRNMFQISTVQAWRDIYLPSIVSPFITGSITAIGAAWNTLIVAEFFSTDPSKPPLTQVGLGIGKYIVLATNAGRIDELTLAIISMTALIVTFNLTIWRRVYHYATKRYTYNR